MSNRFMKCYGIGFGVLVALFLLSGCAAQNQHTALRMHPDFAHSEKKIGTILVLPPEVQFEQTETSGENERLRKREARISESLIAHILENLERRGYKASEFQLEKFQETVEDADFQISQVRTAYLNASNALYEKNATKEEAENYCVCMGPIVNQLAGEAEGVLFTRYYGFEKSKKQLSNEKIALGIQSLVLAGLTGTYVQADPIKSGGMLEIALVDGTTGDILWCNRASGTDFGGHAANYALHGLPPCTAKAEEENASFADEMRAPNGEADPEVESTKDVVEIPQ